MKIVKKIIFGAIMVALSVLILFLYLRADPDVSSDNAEREILIKNRAFKTEIVSTPEKQQLGLGGRENLCANCGMLFVFPEKKEHSFWMKGMEIALDIVWIADSEVIAIEKNIQSDSQEIFSPKVFSDKVLELPAGTVDELGLKVGDKVDL